MRRTRSRLATLLAATLGVAQCDDGHATQLLVLVSSDPAEGLPIEVVEVEVQSEDGLTTYDSERFPIVGATGGRFTLPLSFGVAPRTVDVSGRLRVVARARLREGAAARPLVASALTSFMEGRRLLLPLRLDYRCTLHPPCVAGQSCGALGCLSDARPPTLLRALSPGEEVPSAAVAACARPAEACIDRCDQGSRVAVARTFEAQTRRHTLTTTPDAPMCSGCAVETRAAFELSPSPRPDLLPLFKCREARGWYLYSLQEDCEVYQFNDGVLGYVVSPATPGRCGTVPLYRLYNETTYDHHYTTSASERDRLVREEGYNFEWIVAYVWPASAGP